jgi:hypothetical protein
MTANTPVNPTGNGYAIESYSSVTPSNSSPVTLTSGDVVKLGGNGYAIESYTAKSPSNSTPVALISGEIDKINGNGYAIASYSSITPSNISPATITSGSIYKASANGKAVASVTDVTPSSTPTSLSYGDIIQTFGSGVIVDNITSITPSNSSPVALSTNTPVNPTDSGYAIASYEEIDVPSAVYTHNIYPNMPTISRVGAMIGVEQMHFHGLDPSNSDPDTITDGEIYRADGSGVAVASVTDVIPSSTPTSVSMDDIVHIYGSGVIVDSIPTPTSLTPSNSSPATITSGETYTASANGKAVSSVTDITPSNSSPVSLSSGTIYKPSASGKAISSLSEVAPSNANPPNVHTGDICKITTRDGYLISTINIVEPSDSNPPLLSNNNSWYRLNGASGYLYKTVQPKVKMGTFTIPSGSSNTVTINCGFEPKYIAYYAGTSVMCIYDADVSTTKWIRASSSGIQSVNIGGYNYGLNSVTSSGFTVKGGTNSMTAYYFAVG